MTEREQFEAWYFGDDAPAHARERNGDQYKYMATFVAWSVWQARAALDKSSFDHWVAEQEGNGPDAPSVGGKEGDGWLPIGSAPKDGRVVLYWVASVRFEEDDETGKLREIDVSAADFGCWMPSRVHSEGYHDPFSGIPGDQGGATHWMPVPKPPSLSASQEGAEG